MEQSGAVFYVSVIPISVARQEAWSRAARCFMLVLFLLVWPDKKRGAERRGVLC